MLPDDNAVTALDALARGLRRFSAPDGWRPLEHVQSFLGSMQSLETLELRWDATPCPTATLERLHELRKLVIRGRPSWTRRCSFTTVSSTRSTLLLPI